MGIALFSAAALIESLQGVMGWLAPRDEVPSSSSLPQAPEVWHRPARTRSRTGHAVQGSHAGHGTPVAHTPAHTTATRQLARAGWPPRPSRIASPVRALRVVRVLDAPSSACAGRMVISGRMADVCAELDRLAALEAGIHLPA